MLPVTWKLAFYNATDYVSLWRICGDDESYNLLVGTAADLAVAVVAGTTPIGILLDYLTEYPDGCGVSPNRLAAALSYFRERHPLGV